jgi:hypothetical protein
MGEPAYRRWTLPEGTRRVGRPAIRWLDSTEDLKTALEIGDESHRIGDQWRVIVKEAEVHH